MQLLNLIKTVLRIGFLPLCATCFGASEASRPLGFMIYNIPANSTGALYKLGIPLTSNTKCRFTAISYNEYWQYNSPFRDKLISTVSFQGQPFTPSYLCSPSEPYFARVVAGQQADRIMLITSNSGNSITLDATDNSSQTTALGCPGFSLSTGDVIEIFKGATLASLFGDGTSNNPLLLQGSNLQVTADQIGVYNKSTCKIDYYYFNTNKPKGSGRVTSIYPIF